MQANEHGRYYKGITHYVLDDDEYLLSWEQELSVQVERLGYRCEVIRKVILTHLHEDHVGGLRYAREAKVVRTARRQAKSRRHQISCRQFHTVCSVLPSVKDLKPDIAVR